MRISRGTLALSAELRHSLGQLQNYKVSELKMNYCYSVVWYSQCNNMVVIFGFPLVQSLMLELYSSLIDNSKIQRGRVNRYRGDRHGSYHRRPGSHRVPSKV